MTVLSLWQKSPYLKRLSLYWNGALHKMDKVLQTIFQIHFHERNILYVEKDYTSVWSPGQVNSKSALNQIMTLYWQKFSTCTNDDLICWQIYVSPDLNVLRKQKY